MIEPTPLNSEGDQLKNLVEHVPELIYEYITTPESAGYFTYVSEACRDIYDAEPSELINDADIVWKSIHPEDLHDFTTKFIEAIDQVKVFVWQGRLISRKDFKLKWVKLTAQPVKVDKGTVKWYGVVHDITSFKTIESELQFAKEKAEREAKAKEEFLATMSHDIRTPIGGILGMTDLMMADATDEQKEYLQLLKHAANNLNSLVNNILDFSKLNSGEMIINPARMSLSTMLDSLYQLHHFKADENRNKLIFELDESLPEDLYTDEMIITQILNNLLNNANKFTKDGEVILKLETLSRQESNLKLRISVIDSGIGIGEEDLQTIFEKFKQVGAGINHQGGTGLGLSITKQLVDLMGSKLNVSSTLGEGSCFSFELNLQVLTESKLKQLKTAKKSA